MFWAAVPKTTIDEDRYVTLGEHNVCPPSELRNWSEVNPVAESLRVEESSNLQFRLGVAVPVGLHVTSAGRC